MLPGALAGAGLAAFSAGLIGIPLAKDIWLRGIGTSLVVDDLVAKNRTEGKRS